MDPNEQVEEALNVLEENVAGFVGVPHSFYKRTFSSPTYCNLCGEFIWGLANQGYSCNVCGFVIHKHCFELGQPDAHSSPLSSSSSSGDLGGMGARSLSLPALSMLNTNKTDDSTDEVLTDGPFSLSPLSLQQQQEMHQQQQRGGHSRTRRRRGGPRSSRRGVQRVAPLPLLRCQLNSSPLIMGLIPWNGILPGGVPSKFTRAKHDDDDDGDDDDDDDDGWELAERKSHVIASQSEMSLSTLSDGNHGTLPPPSSPPPSSTAVLDETLAALEFLRLSAVTRHHWVAGNIDLNNHCCSCGRSVVAVGLEALKCSMCKRTTHRSCVALSSKVACEHPHSRLLFHGLSHTRYMSSDAAEAVSSSAHTSSLASTPLLVFSNSRSGDRQGEFLVRRFRRLLSAVQVFDLDKGGPSPVLKLFANVPNMRALVCGGDGSVGWVLSALDKMSFLDADRTVEKETSATTSTARCPRPAVCVLPLGTGNDLARILGWGGGYEREVLTPILRDIDRSERVMLDRWKVTFWPFEKDESGPATATTTSAPTTTMAPTTKTAPTTATIATEVAAAAAASTLVDGTSCSVNPLLKTSHIMNNYFSVGVDAKVALGFHELRNEMPDLCSTRLGNKMIYGIHGLRAMFDTATPLDQIISLEADDRPVILPPDLEGLIICNVPSYAGGSDLWGPIEAGEDDEEEDFEGYAASVPTTSSSGAGSGRTTSEVKVASGHKRRGTADDSEAHMPSARHRHHAIDDGLLEIVGITGCFHMGTIQVNLTSALRIIQASSVTIRCLTATELPTQVDGEPWLQPPSVIHIQHYNRAPMLRNAASSTPSPVSAANRTRRRAGSKLSVSSPGLDSASSTPASSAARFLAATSESASLLIPAFLKGDDSSTLQRSGKVTSL